MNSNIAVIRLGADRVPWELDAGMKNVASIKATPPSGSRPVKIAFHP